MVHFRKQQQFNLTIIHFWENKNHDLRWLHFKENLGNILTFLNVASQRVFVQNLGPSSYLKGIVRHFRKICLFAFLLRFR